MEICDSKGRQIKDRVIYVGFIDGTDPKKFKDSCYGYPKNGYYMTVTDLIYYTTPANDEILSKIGYTPNLTPLQVDDFLQVNSAYLGMQIIDRGEELENRYMYLFFINDLLFFTHIKKYHVSFDVICKILENRYWRAPILPDPISGKFIELFVRDDNTMIISIKTDTALYNSISVIYKYNEWRESDKTTLIFNPPVFCDKMVSDDLPPMHLLLQEKQTDISLLLDPEDKKKKKTISYIKTILDFQNNKESD